MFENVDFVCRCSWRRWVTRVVCRASRTARRFVLWEPFSPASNSTNSRSPSSPTFARKLPKKLRWAIWLFEKNRYFVICSSPFFSPRLSHYDFFEERWKNISISYMNKFFLWVSKKCIFSWRRFRNFCIRNRFLEKKYFSL